jgi:hypothetical protein
VRERGPTLQSGTTVTVGINLDFQNTLCTSPNNGGTEVQNRHGRHKLHSARVTAELMHIVPYGERHQTRLKHGAVSRQAQAPTYEALEVHGAILMSKVVALLFTTGSLFVINQYMKTTNTGIVHDRGDLSADCFLKLLTVISENSFN